MCGGPRFEQRHLAGLARLTTANASRTTYTNVVFLVKAEGADAVVRRVEFSALGDTTPGLVGVWLRQATGSVWQLIGELEVTAITTSGSVKAFKGAWRMSGFAGDKDLLLPDGWELGVSTWNSESFNALAVGGYLMSEDPRAEAA